MVLIWGYETMWHKTTQVYTKNNCRRPSERLNKDLWKIKTETYTYLLSALKTHLNNLPDIYKLISLSQVNFKRLTYQIHSGKTLAVALIYYHDEKTYCFIVTNAYTIHFYIKFFGRVHFYYRSVYILIINKL